MNHGQRASEHGEVLAEDEHSLAVDLATAGDNRISRIGLIFHAKITAGVLSEHVIFQKGAWIAEHFNALPSGQFALFVLGINALLASTQKGSGSSGLNPVAHS